jgi:hypothetical protein
MITLLMVLFVVMFAISNVDQKKFAELSSGLSDGFGAPRFVAMEGAVSPMGGAGPLIDPISVAIPPVGPPGGDATDVSEEEADHEKAAADLAAAQAELARLDAVEAAAVAALTAQGLQDRAGFRITTDGLVVVLFADDVFFANGSASIQPTGERVVDTLAPGPRRSRRTAERRGPRQPPAGRRRLHLPLQLGAVGGARGGGGAPPGRGGRAGRRPGQRHRVRRRPPAGPGVGPGLGHHQPARRPAPALDGPRRGP